MPVRVDVWSDFVCPYCFAASISLKELQKTHTVDIHWRSYELRPEGSPPIPPWYLERIEQSRPQFKQMMLETYGIEIQQGQFGINSRPALIGAKYAEAQSPEIGAAYHDAVLRAYWMNGRDISDLDVLRELAVSAGMDGEAFAAALNEETYDEQVAADVMQAQINGLSGVPALIFEEKFLLSGAQPVEVLRHVIDRIESDGGASLIRN